MFITVLIKWNSSYEKARLRMTKYFNLNSMNDFYTGQHVCMNMQYVLKSGHRFHSFGLKLSRNSIISLESFIIRPDFIHIWSQRKPLALERGWGYSLNEQWLAILPSYIDIDQWISALTLVIYYHGSRKYKRTSHYFRYCKLDYSIFFGGDEEQKWEDEIILRSNDKKRRRNYLVPSKVQVHNLNSKSWTELMNI